MRKYSVGRSFSPGGCGVEIRGGELGSEWSGDRLESEKAETWNKEAALWNMESKEIHDMSLERRLHGLTYDTGGNHMSTGFTLSGFRK
jgi:hypothetical protein